MHTHSQLLGKTCGYLHCWGFPAPSWPLHWWDLCPEPEGHHQPGLRWSCIHLFCRTGETPPWILQEARNIWLLFFCLKLIKEPKLHQEASSNSPLFYNFCQSLKLLSLEFPFSEFNVNPLLTFLFGTVLKLLLLNHFSHVRLCATPSTAAH